MEKSQNYNKIPPYIDLDYDLGQNNIYDKDPFLILLCNMDKPMYYKYLNSQMEYKIRCKEYEKMCRTESKQDKRIIE